MEEYDVAPPDGESSPTRASVVKWLVPGVAHELNNLLVGVIGFAGLAQRRIDKGDGRAQKDLVTVADGAKRAASLIHELLLFTGRSFADTIEETDLGEMIAGTLRLAEYHMRTGAVDIERDFDEDIGPRPVDRRALQEGLFWVLRSVAEARRVDDAPMSVRVTTAADDAGAHIDISFAVPADSHGTLLGLMTAIEGYLGELVGDLGTREWLDKEDHEGCMTLRLNV